MSETTGPHAPRRPGRPATLNVGAIAAAARSMDPSTLTMRAIAQRLGVDRKAVNYHVADKDGLLLLITADAVASAFADLDFSADQTWQQTCERLARAIRRATIDTGVLAQGFRLGRHADRRLLRPVEEVLRRLVQAGAEPQLAGRLLTTLSTLATASAHERLTAAASSGSRQLAEVEAVLDAADPDAFPCLRYMVQHEVAADDDDQFDVDLQVFLAGAEIAMGAARASAVS